MEYHRHISRRLHEEHEATLALWGRVESSLRAGRHEPALIAQAAAALAHELGSHFDFEERSLFPLLAAGGEDDIAGLLREEHDAIRAAGRRFMALAKDQSSDPELKVAGLELAERLFAHVQKEEMSLLPLLDDLIDEAADGELTAEYLT
jgi:iron-sulfur cluster repair protein YtfE (RIC family)